MIGLVAAYVADPVNVAAIVGACSAFWVTFLAVNTPAILASPDARILFLVATSRAFGINCFLVSLTLFDVTNLINVATAFWAHSIIRIAFLAVNTPATLTCPDTSANFVVMAPWALTINPHIFIPPFSDLTLS